MKPLPEVGARAELRRTVTAADIDAFAALTGDTNPVHLDDAFAAGTRFGGRIAHGMWCASLLSAVLGTHLPGPGAIYLAQDLRFRAPVRPGDEITARVEVAEVMADARRLRVRTECLNQDGRVVVDGHALLLLDA